MLFNKSSHIHLRKWNLIRRSNSREFFSNSKAPCLNSADVLAAQGNQSEGSSEEKHINSFGIRLLDSSLERLLFDKSSKDSNKIDLGPAHEHLSNFNINVKDVEKGK